MSPFLRHALVAVALLFAGGCAVFGPQIEARPEPSPTTINVEVVSEEWVVGDLANTLAGLLREEIRNQNIGVPVVGGAEADMILRVRITDTNWTSALAWEWQLIEARTGTIVDSKAESAILGHTPDAMADLVVSALVRIDTAVYAGGSATVPVVRHGGPKGPDDDAQAPASQTDGSKTWVVVVGIENYRNDLPRASHAERDALAFAQLATATLGVPEAQVKVLLGQRATRTDVMGAVSEWLPRNAVQPGGRVYFFFSGHGAPNAEDKGAYLVPWDADPAYLKTGGIAVSEIQKLLGGLVGQDAFVFLDACFSGSGDRSVLAAGTRPLIPVAPSAQAGSIVTLTAAGAGETTGVATGLDQGLFTHYLISGLAGAADADGDANVTLAEVVSHVQQGVERDARRENRDQRPTISLPKSTNAAKTFIVRGLQPAP